MSQKSLFSEAIFLLDSSASVRPRDFKDEITFTKSLANILHLFSGKSRVRGVISYGLYARPITSYTTQAQFNKSVDLAPYVGGNRRMDLATGKSLEIFRQNTHPHLTKILVLVTSGDPSPDSKDLQNTFKSLRKLGIKPFVFTVGGNVDKTKFTSFVDELNDVKDVQSFKELSKVAQVYGNLLMGMLFISR